MIQQQQLKVPKTGFKKAAPYLAGIGVSLIFGFSFLFTKGALDYAFPFQLLGFRFAFATLFLSLLKGVGLIRIDLKGKNWRPLLILAMTQPGLYFVGETWGVKWTTASEAGMMIALVPVATAAMAAFYLKETLRPWQVASIGACVAGVFMIVTANGVEFGSHFYGLLMLLLAVFSAAVFSILSKRFSVNFKPLEITYIMMWTGMLMFNGLGLIQGLKAIGFKAYIDTLMVPQVFWGVTYLGILSSVLAFFLMNYMISKLKVIESAGFINLTTVVAVFAGVVFRGESITWLHIAGVTLIIAGVWGSNLSKGPNA